MCQINTHTNIFVTRLFIFFKLSHVLLFDFDLSAPYNVQTIKMLKIKIPIKQIDQIAVRITKFRNKVSCISINNRFITIQI